jgi:hypothetical protein
MPVPIAGAAVLSGHVVDGTGQPVPGAAVQVAETDGTVIADASGRYSVGVPSDSTLTLAASASGYARTYRESVTLAAGAAVDGFDVTLLSIDQVASMSALADPSQPAGALIAVRLHSMDSVCVPSGTRLSVWPSKAATVVYSRPSALAGQLDEPDATLSAVQPGTTIAAWLVGAVAPGSMLGIEVDQLGCTLMRQAPSMGGLVFSGLRRAEAQALTEADLFVD